ncbi:diguanylate cyclase [Thioalkalivibrio sp. K90mix]|jgi:diguanylate cyclase (GGDEF)-like protein|uniref:GGDEF domain-containing protein n=1 Tax=unclassified Thioalkalivibrio TaxID=2621013 RepID=UPI000195A9A3|nr:MULTISPECIES: GGDEF domain-containing protein [unclassified Thioalkalivibrio]ADC71931.1 diguanylate cyclase [Thioalkalivibrio sp. K90mix]
MPNDSHQPPLSLASLAVYVRLFLRALRAPEYKAARVRDNALFGAVASAITAVFVLLTILMDYAIDPVHFTDAIGLRLAQSASVMLLAWVFWTWPGSLAARIVFIVVPMFVLITFLEILARLEGGAAYGIGGILYFFIFMPFMGRPLGLGFNLFALAVIAITPTLLHAAGFVQHLNLAVYHSYVWVAFLPFALILTLVEFLYWRLYETRIELTQQAERDPLTGLPNRRHFFRVAPRQLAIANRTGQPVSVLFVDIDHFKQVNDTHGHAMGDRALCHVARLLQATFRESDLVTRHGGEEFLVWLQGTGPRDAEQVAEQLRARIDREPLAEGGSGHPPIPLTVSIGIASHIPESPEALDTLLTRADDAMSTAKRQGRNKVVLASSQQS